MQLLFFPLNIFSFIYSELSLINYQLLGVVLSSISLVLLGVITTIFVLTVTLLGRAARLSKEKKAEAEQKSKAEFDKDIKLIQEQISKNPADIEDLKKQVIALETKKQYTEETLRELDKKYNMLGFKESIFIPGTLFLSCIVLENWLLLASQSKLWGITYFGLGLVALGFGISRILVTLKTVQEVALGAEDYQYEQLRTALIDAARTVDADKEPKPFVVFKEKPPFILKNNEVNKIAFSVDLSLPGNKEAKNVDVMFLFSPEIEIIENSNYTKPFKQSSTSAVPNANTTIYKFPLIRKHSLWSGIIKVKPTVPGKFKVSYKVDCDNHAESVSTDREEGIIVQS